MKDVDKSVFIVITKTWSNLWAYILLCEFVTEKNLTNVYMHFMFYGLQNTLTPLFINLTNDHWAIFVCPALMSTSESWRGQRRPLWEGDI